MRCFICILQGTENKDISNDTPVLMAATHANDAVTVFNGTAYCVKHLHEKVISDMGSSLNAQSKKTETR